MINLLPSQQKEELLEEKRLKLALILGIVILSFFVCLSLFLFAIKISISSKLQIQKITIDQKEKDFKTLQNQKLEEEIKNYNNILSQLESFYKERIDLTDIFEKISAVLPLETYLESLSFNSLNGQISLTGFSPNREKLLEFQENLNKTGYFKDINIPASSWVDPAKASIIFKLNDNKE